MKKKQAPKQLKKVTKSNLKDFSKKFKIIVSYGAVFLFSLFFLGISTFVDRPLTMLPQTGEGTSPTNINELITSLVSTPLGSIILIISWILYIILIVKIFKIRIGSVKNIVSKKTK